MVLPSRRHGAWHVFQGAPHACNTAGCCTRGFAWCGRQSLAVLAVQARAYAARARDRSKVLEAEMARQRFIINTFANMNMMQQQMTSHMFGSLLKSQGPAPGSTEVNAMIRSMAKRQGYQGLIKPLNTPGQSYMNGAVDSALPYAGPSAMPAGPSVIPSAMHAGMPAQPQMSAFGAVQMPYLQMAGGAVPMPNSVMGGGTSFSMGGPGAASGHRSGVQSMGALRSGPSSLTAHGGGGSTGSTSGSAGRSGSRPRSHGGCSTPKTPTLGGPMHSRSRSSVSASRGSHRRSSSQRQMQPFGGLSGYAASDGSRMLQPSSMGSDRPPLHHGSSGSIMNGSIMNGSSFHSPQQVHPHTHNSGGSAKTIPRPNSNPLVLHPQHMQAGHGSPDNSVRLSKSRSRRLSSGAPEHPSQAPKPPTHSRGKSATDPARRRDVPRPTSGERPHSRSPDRHLPMAEPKRGRSSRMMAAVQAARRTLSGTRRRSSSRHRSRHNSPNKLPPHAPYPGLPASGGSNRGRKPSLSPQPPPHLQRVPPNTFLRSTTSSGGPSATNSSFLFDSTSSGYSTQFDSLTSMPTSGSGSSQPQAPPTPPQPLPGHRRSKSGGNSGQPPAPSMQPMAVFQAPVTHPAAGGPPVPPPPGHRGGSGVYPGLMPQQIQSPGVRRGAARRMTPQLAATPEVEEEISASFMAI